MPTTSSNEPTEFFKILTGEDAFRALLDHRYRSSDLWALMNSCCVEVHLAASAAWESGEVSSLNDFARKCTYFALLVRQAHSARDPSRPIRISTSQQTVTFDGMDHSQITEEVVGIVYATHNSSDAREANIGAVVHPGARGNGYGSQGILHALESLFSLLQYHRVQACVMDGDSSACLKTFLKLGFSHEGIRRRAIVSQVTGAWTDITCLSILDVEWVVRSSVQAVRSAPQSLWDEMFARHAREREQLLRWEDTETIRRHNLKRAASEQTLRAIDAFDREQTPFATDSECEDERDDDETLFKPDSPVLPPQSPTPSSSSSSDWERASQYSQSDSDGWSDLEHVVERMG